MHNYAYNGTSGSGQKLAVAPAPTSHADSKYKIYV